MNYLAKKILALTKSKSKIEYKELLVIFKEESQTLQGKRNIGMVSKI